MRWRQSRRLLAVCHRWLIAQARLVPPGSVTMKAFDYSFKRWSGRRHILPAGTTSGCLIAGHQRADRRTLNSCGHQGGLAGRILLVGAICRFKRSDIDSWITAQGNQPNTDEKP